MIINYTEHHNNIMATITNAQTAISQLAAWAPSNAAATLLCFDAFYGSGNDEIQDYDMTGPCTRDQLVAQITESLANDPNVVWRYDDGPGTIWATDEANNILCYYCNDEGDDVNTFPYLRKHLCGEIDINALHDAEII